MRSGPSSKLRWAAALAALALCGAAAAAAPLLAAPLDLRADGAQAAAHGKPLVLMFSLPECGYCAVVRRNYLAPLAHAPRPADRFVVRELELTGTEKLAGFHGERTSGATLAARYGVRVAPAVVMLDRDGKLLAPPLLGGDVAGMYGAYLERSLEDARASLAPAGAPKP